MTDPRSNQHVQGAGHVPFSILDTDLYSEPLCLYQSAYLILIRLSSRSHSVILYCPCRRVDDATSRLPTILLIDLGISVYEPLARDVVQQKNLRVGQDTGWA
jgi:hypothetical protein